MTSQPVGRLPLLDALRTIAAIGVLLFHVPELFGFWLFRRGYLFVDLFFLISGFVLALSAEPRMKNGLGTFGFFRARVRRLWPMTALGALAGCIVFAPQVPVSQVLELLFLGLLFVPLLSGSPTLYPLNPPQWSLLWELAANLGHGLLLRRLSETGLLMFAAVCAIGLAGAILWVGCNCFGPNDHFWWLTCFRIGWSYTIGVWMARRWTAARPRALADWRTALVLPVAALIALPWLPVETPIGDAITVILVLPTLFWIAVSATPPAASHPGLERLGALSFPIYAVNMPVILAFAFSSTSALSRLAAVVTTILLAGLITVGTPRIKAQLDRVRKRSLNAISNA